MLISPKYYIFHSIKYICFIKKHMFLITCAYYHTLFITYYIFFLWKCLCTYYFHSEMPLSKRATVYRDTKK